VATIVPRRMTDVVGRLHDLAQLVGDQDDRLALVLQPFQDAEQVVGLIRGQNPGRFVQDQDLGLTIERLQDFHPLLVADRQVLDQRVGVDLQVIIARQTFQLFPRLRERGVEHRPILDPEDDVFQHGEVLHQLEMLEHHADARADRALAVGDRSRLAVDEDLARIGLVEAVQDRHQRRLARAVFADDAVDRALRHRDVDVLVRLDRTEGLGNARQFDGKCHISHVFPLSGPPSLGGRLAGSSLQRCRTRGLARHHPSRPQPIRTWRPGRCCPTCSRGPRSRPP
jgi:hypothetical protein